MNFFFRYCELLKMKEKMDYYIENKHICRCDKAVIHQYHDIFRFFAILNHS